MSLLSNVKAKTSNYNSLLDNGNNIFTQEKFPLLLNSIPSNIIYVDKYYCLQYVNSAFEKTFDAKSEGVIGKSLKEFFVKTDNSSIVSYMEKALAGEEVNYEIEVEIKKVMHVFSATCTPDFDETGKVNGFVGLINDITEKHRKEGENKNIQLELQEKLQLNENSYNALIENIPAAIYTCDTEGYVQLYNKFAVELWGREPLAGKDKWCGSWKIYEPDGTTPMDPGDCPMAQTLKKGIEIKGKEIIVERPDGTRTNVQPNPVPIFDKDGKIIGAVNMLIDVTNHKIEEQKLAHLAAIVRSSSDAIISKTLNGIITSWNEAAGKMFGYTSSEIIGQSVAKLIPEDRLDEEPLILERIKKGEVVEHFETKRITKNKKILDISLTISPVKDSGGTIIGASKIARDITAQKRLDEALRESEERLRMAVKSTKLGTWEFIPATGMLSWSDECRKIYDVPDNMEVDYAFFSKHIHPDDAEYAQEAIMTAMKPESDGNYDIQYRILRYSDRQSRWIRSQGKVYFNSNLGPERFIGTVLDITEEKTQEQELKNSVELFTTMADNVPAMIWMSGDDKFCDFFNRTWLAFTGRTIEQESNQGWLKNVHPDDIQKSIDNYNQSFKEERGFYSEYRLKRNDGVYRWIADNSVPRYNADKSFVGFISACMDIDDQKNFREKILASELKLKTISNAAPVGLWMTDVNGQNIFVNDTWIEWTGIPYHKQLGQGWLDKVIEEDRHNAPALFRERMEKREKFTAEFRIIRTNGELCWCLTEGSPYYDIDGSFAGYAGSVTDITEMKKMEERKDDFIKMASHELKTPITSIKGYAQLLLSIYDEVNEEKFQASRSTVKSSLTTISKQVSKLTRLISELLDLTRIESGKLELHKSVFDLSSLIEEAVQDVRYTTNRHAIIIHNNFEGTIYADKDRLSQVLLNLLTNAIKYSPAADKVEIFVDGDKTKTTIKIKDFGIGIDKRDQSKIFHRFYRVEGKSEQTFPGFGIGLFIASEIVQRHNGIVQVESQKNKGSTFIITLPVPTEN